MHHVLHVPDLSTDYFKIGQFLEQYMPYKHYLDIPTEALTITKGVYYEHSPLAIGIGLVVLKLFGRSDHSGSSTQPMISTY